MKVGDYVIGKINNDYYVTNKDCIMQIEKIYSDGVDENEEMIMLTNVKVITHKNTNKNTIIGGVYPSIELNELRLLTPQEKKDLIAFII